MEVHKPEIYGLIDKLNTEFSELGIITFMNYNPDRKHYIVTLVGVGDAGNLNRAFNLFEYNALLYGYTILRYRRTRFGSYKAYELIVVPRRGRGEFKIAWE
jgi:hypothetical protein